MSELHTHYNNLRVTRNAPPEVIRAAYKALVQKYHPDKHPGSDNATRILLLVNEAYAVLSDPKRKAEHDSWIDAQPAPGYPGSPTQLPPALPPARRGPKLAWVGVLVILAFGLGMALALKMPSVPLHLR
ncbi:J domain-containing protein [Pseudomonas sp. KNUC1026]|uniref:J domain-containing protein n=1 Tax=Pseudomonas sp. KNUC1026 TaxID=2893890 RepID=UPI001F44A7DE|nr:J domain-containing protein [Pseudomonas sp. KNUC1026]UFH50513.1 J domain-containing protein [Pseudomonas sp. KNUC1026]